MNDRRVICAGVANSERRTGTHTPRRIPVSIQKLQRDVVRGIRSLQTENQFCSYDLSICRTLTQIDSISGRNSRIPQMMANNFLDRVLSISSTCQP